MIILKIDRKTPLGLSDLGLKIVSIHNRKETLPLIETLDLTRVKLYGGGDEGRPPAGAIALDAKIFELLRANESLVPEEWKRKRNNKTQVIFFLTYLCEEKYTPETERVFLPYYFWNETTSSGWWSSRGFKAFRRPSDGSVHVVPYLFP